MSYEHNEKGGTQNDDLHTYILSNDREHLHPSRRTAFKRGEMRAQSSDEGSILINSRDHASIDRIVTYL